MMDTPRGGYAPNISASKSLQLPQSRILAKNTMNKDSSENPRIEGQIRRLRGQDHSQRGTMHPPMIPSKKSSEKHPQIDKSSDERKSQEKTPKINEKEKREEQQEHLRNHTQPSIHTMKDSYKV
jgi:hypothetical protein